MAKKKTNTNTKTNLEKLRQAYEKSMEENTNINWYRPKWGKNLIRILPSTDPDGLFYHEVARHKVGDKWYYCLKYDVDENGKQKKCPICEARTKLYRITDPDTEKVAKEVAREIKPRKQYLMNIISRDDDDPTKVYVYASGVKVWNKIVSTMLDDDIDITDVEEGYDFLLKKEEGPRTELGTFPSYDNSKAKRQSSPLAENSKIIKQILDNRYDLQSITQFESSEEIEEEVNYFIGTMMNTETEDAFFKKDTTEESQEKSGSKISDFRKKLSQSLIDDDDDDEE